MPTTIECLEKISELIDLCIDRELYDRLDEIITFSNNPAGGNGDNNVNAHREKLREVVSAPSQIKIGWGDFPVTEVKYIEGLGGYLKDYEGTKCLTRIDIDEDLRKAWSNLFWVKSLRALLLEKNQDTWNDPGKNEDTWNDKYSDLILYLEAHLTFKKEGEAAKNKEYNITLFNYLMELSALDSGEGSYGYAERARMLLKNICGEPSPTNNKRKPYDRWIWWNKGIALQHMGGRNQKAVLQFNRLIKDYTDQIELICKERKKEFVYVIDDNPLEFLLNIWPAVMQRAAIQQRLQLGYQSLKTLRVGQLTKSLDKIKNDQNGFLKEAAEHLWIKTTLMEMEACLTLSDLEEAKKGYKKVAEKEKNIDFPSDCDIDKPIIKLPQLKASLLVTQRKAYHTQLIEFIVSYHLEKLRIIKITKSIPKETKDREKRKDEIVNYINGIKDIYDEYSRWIEGNSFDKRIYFTRFAQGLKEITRLYNDVIKIKDPTSEDEIENLSKKIFSYYEVFSDEFIQQKEHKFEKYRSDDLPDIKDGLKAFYGNVDKADRKGCFAEHLTELKNDYWGFLYALDEYEREFGENLRIDALKRCNERLVMHKKEKDSSCGTCPINICGNNFEGLLVCTEKKKLFSIIGERCHIPDYINKLFRRAPVNNDDSKNEPQLSSLDYDYLMQHAEKQLTRHLSHESLHEPYKEALHFQGLQRWNSLTPAQGRSVGGGYLLYRTDKDGKVDLGIAIDPGFDYVRNLFKMGFSLKDIDIILISHAHADHLWDFESIIQLLHELNKKKKIVHRINVLMTLGIYHRLEHIITNPELRRYINPLIIDIEKEIIDDFLIDDFIFYKKDAATDNDALDNNASPLQWRPFLGEKNDLPKDRIAVKCTRAYHEDFSERSDSYGFITKFINDNMEVLRFGFTGDTKWVGMDLYGKGCPLYDENNGNCSASSEGKQEDDKKCRIDKESKKWVNIASQYNECDVLLLHIGSLIDHRDKNRNSFKYYDSPEKCEALIRKENHPYLMGMIRFIKEINNNQKGKDTLYLLGEFGEELRGGIRTDLITRLQKGLDERRMILPVDVGLDVLLCEAEDKNDSSSNVEESDNKYKFLCSLCGAYRSIGKVEYARFGQDEAIFHVCKTCKKSFPQDVQQNKFQQLYEIGRELKTAPNQNESNAS